MKFSAKITVCMLCLLCLLFGIGGSLLITLSYNNALDRERTSAYNSYQSVMDTLRIVNGASNGSDYDDISATLEQLSSQSGRSWYALCLHTNTATIYQDGKFDFSKIERSKDIDKCLIRYHGVGKGNHYLAVSGSLEVNGEIIYLDMIYDISPIIESQKSQQRLYMMIFGLLVVLCAILSTSMAKIITKPLMELSKASREISGGDISRRVEVSTTDEIGMVAADFNNMVGTLQDNIEQREQFIGAFAHESKTPMTSIIGYGDLIRGGTLSESERIEAANYIVSEGKRLENLSQKMLELLVIKNSETTFEYTQPSAVINGIVHHMAPVLKQSGISISCRCEEGACFMDQELIKSLIINLIDNSRKAMSDRGGMISIESAMTDDGCTITVTDNGCGMPEEAIRHITEAFYRVDKSRSREQGGAGLGLALCEKIIAIHNGDIRFDSEVGKGTCATVELRGGRI